MNKHGEDLTELFDNESIIKVLGFLRKFINNQTKC